MRTKHLATDGRSDDLRASAGSWSRLIALAIGQILGWGSTFYLPVIFVDALARDLQLSREAVFGGVTVMLLVSAATAMPAGMWLARAGPRRVMVVGVVLLATGAIILATARGLGSYLAAWTLFGVAAPLALSQAAITSVQQLFITDARRAIGVLSIVTALTPAIVWPAFATLEPAFGWRGCCFGIVILHLCVALPLNVWGAPGRAPVRREPKLTRQGPSSWNGAVFLLAIAFATTSLVTWGLALNIVPAAEALGHPQQVAIAAGAVAGAAQIVGRVVDGLLARRVGLTAAGAGALILMLGGLTTAALAADTSAGLFAFVGLYGTGAGVLTIVRAALPAALFGPSFPMLYGRLTALQNLACALGPVVVAIMIGGLGLTKALGCFSAITLVSALAFLVACRLISSAPAAESSPQDV
jgi:predicted MFS family arabinose efflux permease